VEAGKAYQSTDDCLSWPDDQREDGQGYGGPGDYARDFARVLENRHAKIFCTIEAFKAIPLKDETVQAYEQYIRPRSSDGGDRR
jgi:hypothetical protein